MQRALPDWGMAWVEVIVVSATRQSTRGAKRAVRKVQETPDELTRDAAGAGEQVQDVAEGASEQGQGLFDETGGGKGSSGESQTLREELAAIVREAAIEVLAPVARQATRYAAKYAIQRGPKLAQQKLMPRLNEMLDSVQEAGGAGAFARDALGAGGGVLSRLGGGGEEEDEDDSRGTWRSAKAPVEEHVDVAVGIQDAYEYFQQFGQRVNFMSDHEQVDEVSNERIVWESTDGVEAICVITFHEMAERLTRVMVTYEAHPHGLQKATSALRLPRRVVKSDLLRFKSLVEVHPEEAENLVKEPDEPEARDEAPELDEEEAEPDEEEEEPEAQEDEPEAQEEDEPAPPKARRRSQPTRSRQGGESTRTQPAPKAAAQPRKRAVRSGAAQSGSGGGGRRQSQSAPRPRASRARAKG